MGEVFSSLSTPTVHASEEIGNPFEHDSTWTCMCDEIPVHIKFEVPKHVFTITHDGYLATGKFEIFDDKIRMETLTEEYKQLNLNFVFSAEVVSSMESFSHRSNTLSLEGIGKDGKPRTYVCKRSE